MALTVSEKLHMRVFFSLRWFVNGRQRDAAFPAFLWDSTTDDAQLVQRVFFYTTNLRYLLQLRDIVDQALAELETSREAWSRDYHPGSFPARVCPSCSGTGLIVVRGAFGGMHTYRCWDCEGAH